jgi:hypothetical protein
MQLSGLGVLDLQRQGVALCLGWCWLAHADRSKPWAGLLQSADSKLSALVAASTTVQVGDGQLAPFWHDAWLDVRSLHELVPKLVDAVPIRIERARIIGQALQGNAWCRDIRGMLTVPVLNQYLHTWQLLQHILLAPWVTDRFIWRWSASGAVSSASAYNVLFTGQTTLFGAKEL